MKNTVKIDVSALTGDLIRVKQILSGTDDMACAQVCNLYIELCVAISEGLVIDPLTKSIAEQQMDGQDRSNRHSISGGMNNPSLIQEKYKKEDTNARS